MGEEAVRKGLITVWVFEMSWLCEQNSGAGFLVLVLVLVIATLVRIARTTRPKTHHLLLLGLHLIRGLHLMYVLLLLHHLIVLLLMMRRQIDMIGNELSHIGRRAHL